MKLTLPIYWQITNRKKALIGLNNYRNWHYRVNSKCKIDIGFIVKQQIKEFNGGNIQGKFKLQIDLYYKTVRCDGSNVVALIEKIVLDVLQEEGVIEQDNVLHHISTTWTVKGIDKENSRCEVTVLPYA